jgi:hypothetical protein
MADSIKFDPPLDGTLHLIEHPAIVHDPNGRTDDRRLSPIPAGEPHWRLAFVQAVQKVRVAPGPPDPNNPYLDRGVEVKGTLTTIVYGFIEPVESALKTAREAVGKAECSAAATHDLYFKAEQRYEERERELKKLAAALDVEKRVAEQLQKRNDEYGVRRVTDLEHRHKMEAELAAVKAYFGAAEYAKAIAGLTRPV